MSFCGFIKRTLFCITFSSFLCLIGFILFKPIYEANSIIIPYSLHPYDICISYPNVWKNIQFYFIVFYIASSFFSSNSLYSLLFIHKEHKIKTSKKLNSNIKQFKNNNLLMFVGKNESDNLVYIPEKSLYQNILVTGTIGSGKTSSCMYPFTKQLIAYKKDDPISKIGMLILDVKGNFYKEVVKFASFSNRLDDLYIIELGKDVKYNPLDKPDLKPIVLANRLKTILMLFSPNNGDSYWLDKVEQILCEAIKFCRLYNDGYVTFLELHKLITVPNYYIDKLDIIKDIFAKRKII